MASKDGVNVESNRATVSVDGEIHIHIWYSSIPFKSEIYCEIL